MKLTCRERVDGTGVTIGRRAYYRGGKQSSSKYYAAEYRDDSGKQICENLGTTNLREARRRAIEIAQRIEAGQSRIADSKLSIDEIVDGYYELVTARGLAKKTQAKYRTDLDKLQAFCRNEKIIHGQRFTREVFFRYRADLVSKKYADKTVYGALILTKQVFKWAYQEGKLNEYKLVNAKVEKAHAKPQPCFTGNEVELILGNTFGIEQVAFAILAYEGLRVGELEQLNWSDVKLDRGDLGMLHICRGGSSPGKTKTKRDRFVPIHPRVRPFLESLPRVRGERLVLPDVSERKLLKRLKLVCKSLGMADGESYKLHSFRHHFASMCANHQVAYKKALAWLGHRSSDILDLYYHLNDAESQSAMASLAADTITNNPVKEIGPAPLILDEGVAGQESIEGTLRAQRESKIETPPEILWEKELLEVLGSKAERAGFEPAVRVIPVRRFSKPLPSATRPPLQRCPPRKIPRRGVSFSGEGNRRIMPHCTRLRHAAKRVKAGHG